MKGIGCYAVADHRVLLLKTGCVSHDPCCLI